MYFNSKNKSFTHFSIIYFIRKILDKFYLFSLFNIKCKIKALLYFKSIKVRIGKNVTLKGIGTSIKLGSDINIYNNCVFEFGSNSQLLIGDHVIFSYGCVLCVNKSIKIGNHVQIGEYTSIRDTTHDYVDYFKPIMKNQDISDSISIGNNVWIGRNCLIFPGAVIEDGVVIGANSLVKGVLKSNKIYGGNPLREIKSRPITKMI
jgi:acetyltransferase-like isoleucine patch superfamily enzyme